MNIITRECLHIFLVQIQSLGQTKNMRLLIRSGLSNKWDTWPSYGRVFGARLRLLRDIRGITQQRLGEICGLSRNQISNLERNDNNARTPAEPSLSTIYKLSSALMVPPAVMLPAGSEIVGGVCDLAELVDGIITFELVWPRYASDTEPFTEDQAFAINAGINGYRGSRY